MNPLTNLLEKFRDLMVKSGDNKKQILEAFEKCVKIKLEEKDIDVRDTIIYMRTSPSIKNAVYMRKQQILRELEACLGKHAPKDIR